MFFYILKLALYSLYIFNNKKLRMISFRFNEKALCEE